jgi:phosphoribosylaminoimidazole-succinocarboxamide synthase
VRRWVAARVDPYRDQIPPIPREIIAEAARIYVSVFETITGESFAVVQPETSVIERIRTNLRQFF